MKIDIIRDLYVCTDCLMFHANGPEDVDPIALPEIIAGCEREAPYEWTCDDSEETQRDFSWSPCACCRSRLGGSRHRMALIKREG